MLCLLYFWTQIFLNNSFALDSTWIYPEESRLFHGHEKPHVLANQVAMSLSRPAPASRPLPTVVLAPQPVPGECPSGCNSVWLSSSYFAFSHRLVWGMKILFVVLMKQFSQVLKVKYNFFLCVWLRFSEKLSLGYLIHCGLKYGICFKMKTWLRRFARIIFLLDSYFSATQISYMCITSYDYITWEPKQ